MHLKRPLIFLLFAVGSAAAEPILPFDPDKAAKDWEFDATRFQLLEDEITNRPALRAALYRERPSALHFVAKEPLNAPSILEAEVRLPADLTKLEKGFSRANASIGMVYDEDKSGVIMVSRGRSRDAHSYQIEGRLGKETKKYAIAPKYKQEGISPLMDPHARLILEGKLGKTPVAHERIYRLRLETREDSLRMFVNGRFAGEFAGEGLLAGRPAIKLFDDARLLSFNVRKQADFDPKFVPIPLDDLVNGTADFGELKPEIEGVPFVAGSENYLDVGQSVHLHRMGNFRIGDARESVFRPEDLEPTRFRLRVPERTWRRAWVLAAADDKPNTVPLLTVRFYRPRTAWATDGVAEIPGYAAESAPEGTIRVAKRGKKSLWLVPVELDAAALAAEPFTCLELSKAFQDYRSWPDPAYYGSFPGGLPSSIHVYGLTLEEAPIRAVAAGSETFGKVFADPNEPEWRVLLSNLSGAKQEAKVEVRVTGPYGEVSEHAETAKLDAGGETTLTFAPKARSFGLYTVETTVAAGDFRQTRQGTFLRVPDPAVRKATPRDSAWGLWCWNGTHDTNRSFEANARLLKALGAVNNFAFRDNSDRKNPVSLHGLRQRYGLGVMHHRLVPRRIPEWSYQDPHDPAAYAAYAEEKGKEAAALLAEHPDLKYVNFFAENHISLRVTHGMSPWAFGEPYFDYDEREASRVKAHWLTAKSAVEGVRKHAPQLKVLFGHGAGNFCQPFFRLEDWDNGLFDGFGLDLPQFERMPERQPRATEPNLLWFLHHQMKEKGLEGKEMVHLESYFPSSGPMALTYQQQASSVVRTAMLSMAMGTTQFMRTWELHTSGDGWGSSHYGSAGLIDRAPEFNPKPAAAAFATMTRVVDAAKFDGWLETGSRSGFCLRFRDADGKRHVYPVWTIRGTRPMKLSLSDGAEIVRIDHQGNEFAVENAAVELSSTPQWLVVRGGMIESAKAGPPVYQARPGEHRRLLADFDGEDWRYAKGEFERFQNNHWDMPRRPGAMKFAQIASEERGSKVLQVELTNPDENAPLAGFYGVFEPPAPIEIPGQARYLGMRVNGHSAWNRFIYEIEDAKGERWLSCGTKDAWNCDDIHSWSSANHDGWRYLRFPLPGNEPGDNFRQPDSTWWGSDAEGIVDLPVKLTKLIVEMRPKMIYVNELMPVESLTLEFDDLTAEYETAAEMTPAPVELQRAAAGLLHDENPAPLPNPFTELRKSGANAAPKIARVFPPDQGHDGTKLYLEIQPVAGAERYLGYVSAYADGRGAKPLGIDRKSTSRYAKDIAKPNLVLFNALQPAMPLYFFVTTLDSNGAESKPSEIREVVLKDEFPFK